MEHRQAHFLLPGQALLLPIKLYSMGMAPQREYCVLAQMSCKLAFTFSATFFLHFPICFPVLFSFLLQFSEYLYRLVFQSCKDTQEAQQAQAPAKHDSEGWIEQGGAG